MYIFFVLCFFVKIHLIAPQPVASPVCHCSKRTCQFTNPMNSLHILLIAAPKNPFGAPSKLASVQGFPLVSGVTLYPLASQDVPRCCTRFLPKRVKSGMKPSVAFYFALIVMRKCCLIVVSLLRMRPFAALPQRSVFSHRWTLSLAPPPSCWFVWSYSDQLKATRTADLRFFLKYQQYIRFPMSTHGFWLMMSHILLTFLKLFPHSKTRHLARGDMCI